jgi:hypothetical protein
MADFPRERVLIGVEMGVAYGGGVEALAKLWRGRGVVLAYDTFTGHPKKLALKRKSMEATCMDMHYKQYGRKMLSYEYQRQELTRQNISNVLLFKGLIHKKSCEDIPKIHYCLLDLDILASMKTGYSAVADKIVPRGYLCLHDVLSGVLPDLIPWYNKIKKEKRWQVVFEGEKEDLAVLRRKK